MPYNNEPKESESLKEASGNQINIGYEVFEKIAGKYNLSNTDMPAIKSLTNDDFKSASSMNVMARYSPELKTVIIAKNFGEEGKSYLCHEYFHYLSDNKDDNSLGFEYLIDSNKETYLVGHGLNEGVTNFFSTKVYKHPEGTCIYEFETHIADMLSVAYGEEELWNYFINGDIEP